MAKILLRVFPNAKAMTLEDWNHALEREEEVPMSEIQDAMQLQKEIGTLQAHESQDIRLGIKEIHNITWVYIVKPILVYGGCTVIYKILLMVGEVVLAFAEMMAEDIVDAAADGL